MAEDDLKSIDGNAQILIIFLREELCDSEGTILTAEKHRREITEMG